MVQQQMVTAKTRRRRTIEKFATTVCRNKSLQLLPLLVVVVVGCLAGVAQANDNLRVAYQWKQMDFNYPNAAARANAIASGAFIPDNVIPVGLEVYKTRLFMTLPRWRTGVPASLVYIDMADNSTLSPKLTPYPNWEAHCCIMQ